MAEAAQDKRDSGRILTWRTLVFGMGGVFIMSGLAPYHDNVLGNTMMVGNHMPGGVFTYMIFLGLFWNGLWKIADRVFGTGGGLTRALSLSTRELVVVMAVTLVACFPPTSGLGRYFHRMVMLPWYYLPNQPMWIEHNVLAGYLNPVLFPDPWPGSEMGADVAGYNTIYHGFFTGLASGVKPLSIAKLWDMGIVAAWAKPLASWGSLLVLLSIAIISLQFLVHRQWSKHEQLSYPVAQVAGVFCKISGPEKGVPDVFRNPLFWWGFIPAFSLLMVIYLSAWYPQSIPSLQQMLPSFKNWGLPVLNHFPVIGKFPDVWGLNGGTLYFTIVGLAYFVSSEISLTMGFSLFLAVGFYYVFYLFTGQVIDSGWTEASRAGAYIGYTGILVYTGRNYYKTVFGKALGLNRKPRADGVDADEEALSVTAARTLLVAFAAFTVALSWICQSWIMALFYALLTMIMYLVLSRIVCETGVPFIQAAWNPGPFIIKLLGPAAAGPKALTYMLYSSGILTQDPRESLMPYAATGVKIAEDNKVKLRRLFWIVIGATILALAISWLSCTYTFYNHNPWSDGWGSVHPVKNYLNTAAQNFNDMKVSGVFEKSADASPLARLGMASVNSTNVWPLRFFVGGMLAVVALAMIRFRFSKFPIHPVIMLVGGTYPALCSYTSFLIGWFVKALVTRFGGGGVYQRLKPLFIGLIAAELFMIGLTVFIAFVYYWIYGTRPPANVGLMPG